MIDTLSPTRTTHSCVPEATQEKLRTCPQVLLYGAPHNYYKVAFVSAEQEVLPVLLKEPTDAIGEFSVPDPLFVALSARSPRCCLVTRQQARYLLGECSYFGTRYPDPDVLEQVLDWLR